MMNRTKASDTSLSLENDKSKGISVTSKNETIARQRNLDELKAALQESFSIDDYLEYRERFPHEDTALWMIMANNSDSPSFGLDFAFQIQHEMEKFGIQTETYLGALEGDVDYADQLCLMVLGALSHRIKLTRENAHAVGQGLAISDNLVDFLITAVLEVAACSSMGVPDSFQILLKVRLGMFKNAVITQRVLHHRRLIAKGLMAKNPDASARTIAKRLGVNVSTISHWMADETFMRDVELFRRFNALKPK